MLENIYLLMWSIRNFFVRPFLYHGPTLICYKATDEVYNNFTTGKIYYSERRDEVSYYVKNDNDALDEVARSRFTLIKKIK